MKDEHNDLDRILGDLPFFKDDHFDLSRLFPDFGNNDSAEFYDGADLYHSPEELMSHFKEGLDCQFEADRKALRRYAPQMKSFFCDYFEELLSQQELEIQEADIKNFMAICYFAAETHETALYDSILSWLYPFSDEDLECLGDFLTQQLPSVLYGCYDGDIEKTMSFLEEASIAEGVRNGVCRMLIQLDLDGVFSPRKHVNLIQRAINAFEDNGCEASCLVEWIILTGEASNMRKELKDMLTFYVDPMMFGTTNVREVRDMVHIRGESYIQRALVMDDAIHHGLFSGAVHPPEGLRKQVLKEQVLRLQQMK
ncbi:MAG: hypothetical protein IJ865_00360 [Clostridia bacterium]|nr:hypothetical protein [Clostridia bacterium]